ncbi:MAG: hypothetical protein Q9177_002051 [Variospora cf. flavescens]
MTIPDLDRQIDEWYAKRQKSLNWDAQRRGYSSWEDYQAALAREEKEIEEAHRKQDEEDAARGIRRTGTPTCEDLVKIFGDRGGKCNCQEHWLGGFFCPGSLEQQPGSRENSLAAAIDDSYQPQTSQLNMLVNDRPSRRYSDEDDHNLWSLNSQDKKHQLPIPTDLKWDPITQELWARKKNQLTENADGLGLNLSPVMSTVQSSLTSVTSSTASALQVSEVLASKARCTRIQRSGRGIAAAQVDADMKRSGAQLGTGRAPSMKSSDSKKKVETATPQWLRSLLEQPTQTRSKDRKVFLELDQQCQVVTATPRRQKKNTRTRRS